MPFNPEIHHRQSNRLRGWDYTTPGAYFVTICTCGREPLFEDAAYREIAENAWRAIPTYPHAAAIALDEYVVMPDHVHGILLIDDGGAVEEDGRCTRDERLRAGSVGAIVGNFKSLVARRINSLRGTPGERVWQRGYHDHIIRNDREMDAIREYIRENPARWAATCHAPDGEIDRPRQVG